MLNTNLSVGIDKILYIFKFAAFVDWVVWVQVIEFRRAGSWTANAVTDFFDYSVVPPPSFFNQFRIKFMGY